MTNNFNVRVEEDRVIIDGYVNAVERKSKLLNSRIGRFFEKIRAGVFTRALQKNKDVKLFLNHDPSVEYASTKDGSIELVEDSIGLRAHTELTDPEIVNRAKNGELVGWSFGFYDVDGGYELNWDTESNYPTRTVNDLELVEVSLIDNTMSPAYEGTLVTVRNEEGQAMNVGGEIDDTQDENQPQEQGEQEQPKEEPEGNDNEPESNENEPEATTQTPEQTTEQEPEQPKEEVEKNSIDLSAYKNTIAKWRE